MELSNRFRNPLSVLVILVIIIEILLRIFYIITGQIEYITSVLTIDDSYYYFETAWNTKKLGYVTFDTINKTNGAHFLWFWLICLYSFLFNNKYVFLLFIMFLCLIINCLCYIITWNIGKMIKDEWISVLLTLFWTMISFGLNFYMSGMENSLHALVIWMISYYCIKITKEKQIDRKDFLIATFFLILNVWTRYDGVILSAVVYIFILMLTLYYSSSDSNFEIPYKYIAISFFMIIIGALIQFIGFFLMGDSILPVSAEIKLYFSSFSASFEVYRDNLIFILFPISRIIIDSSKFILGVTIILFLLLLCINMYIIFVIAKKRLINHRNYPLFIVILIFSISNLFYSIIIANGYRTYYFWYLSLSFVLWTLIGSLIALKISEIIIILKNQIAFPKLGIINQRAVIAIFTWSIFFLSLFLFFKLNSFNPSLQGNEGNLYSLRYEVAIWLRENTNENDIIGSWNAGQLGFFSERRVVNLDGLINHISYFENIIKNGYRSAEFSNYLDKMNITYLVDYKVADRCDPIGNNFIKIREFSSANFDWPIEIWIDNSG